METTTTKNGIVVKTVKGKNVSSWGPLKEIYYKYWDVYHEIKKMYRDIHFVPYRTALS